MYSAVIPISILGIQWLWFHRDLTDLKASMSAGQIIGEIFWGVLQGSLQLYTVIQIYFQIE